MRIKWSYEECIEELKQNPNNLIFIDIDTHKGYCLYTVIELTFNCFRCIVRRICKNYGIKNVCIAKNVGDMFAEVVFVPEKKCQWLKNGD